MKVGGCGIGRTEEWRMCEWGVERGYVCGVKMARKMAGDEDGPALAAITYVAWSSGPISA